MRRRILQPYLGMYLRVDEPRWDVGRLEACGPQAVDVQAWEAAPKICPDSLVTSEYSRVHTQVLYSLLLRHNERKD